MIRWLASHEPFPPVAVALECPDGLLAASADLGPERLLDAYRKGIFPWYGPNQPVLWWSPDPRLVLFPSEFKISRSLKKSLRRCNYEIRVDTDFEKIMRACAAPRGDNPDTWINEEMISAYGALHHQGFAHSIETWIDGELMGGLYGLALGRMFYGESMFTRVVDASKIALAHLARQLERWNFGLIDCQVATAHLTSLGARELPRQIFMNRLAKLVNYESRIGYWHFDDDLRDDLAQ
jgi:leucyl/phenylalanyl-tRNA--protein transferase